ncbi:MAG: type II/IV secretion system ATPase subunit [Nanopusillaceae archaeon]
MPEEQIQKLENNQEYIIKREKTNVINIETTEDFNEALAKYSHLRNYINDISRKIGLPEWRTSLDYSLKSKEEFNILYPVGDPIFIHVYKLPTGEIYYNVIEPELTKEEEEKLEKIQTKIVKYAVENIDLNNIEEVKKTVIDLFNKVVEVGKRSLFSDKVYIRNKEEYDKLLYFLIRERFGYGFLEPFLRDPYLEDVHILGLGPIYVVHKIFGMLKTNRKFEDEIQLNKYIIKYSEIVDRPISETRPIVDAILPDGSRVNFIYGKDISLHGSSFTIRKFSAKPLSITQLISFGTISPEEAAYLWLAIENGMNIVVSGETASGKTTLLNALATFIKPDAKVYSVEDTPELNIPHKIWQRLVTREVGRSADVSMYDLLVAALRSRPNYILIGEIRGKEGYVAFQAMQTGHPVMTTFHSGNITSLIERLTGEPINIPITFIDNLNIAVFTSTVTIKGKMERRVVSIYEIEKYIAELKKVAVRRVFSWDSVRDRHIFSGKYNSYILEKKIAPLMKIDDKRKIYEILEYRTKILKRMVEEQIFDFFEVYEILKNFYINGPSALPFSI